MWENWHWCFCLQQKSKISLRTKRRGNIKDSLWCGLFIKNISAGDKMQFHSAVGAEHFSHQMIPDDSKELFSAGASFPIASSHRGVQKKINSIFTYVALLRCSLPKAPPPGNSMQSLVILGSLLQWWWQWASVFLFLHPQKNICSPMFLMWNRGNVQFSDG